MTVNLTAAAIRTAMLLAITLVGIVQAGYVDFYRDADFERKITRIKPVQVDTCYNLGCFGLDDAVTSAKWGELPERTFKDAFTKIEFYTSRGCTSKHKAWLVKTQSDSDLHFPKNFNADGINDAISSFMVVKEGKGDNEEYVCSESGNFLSTNSSIETK